MQRPDVPAGWRLGVAAAGLLLLSLLLLGDAFTSAPPAGFLVVGVGLALGMLQGDRRDRLAMAGGLGFAVIVGLVTRSHLAFLASVGIGMPVALAAARPHAVATPLAVIAAGALVLAFANATRYPLERGIYGAPRDWIFGAIIGALAIALLSHAALARSAPTPRAPRWQRYALVAVGYALLAASWALGGAIADITLWPLGIAALVVPALVRARRFPAQAALVAAIALAGAFPAATCERVYEGPYVGEPVPPLAQTTTLAQAMGRGPASPDGELFSVRCGGPVLAAGLAWAIALVAAAAWSQRRE